MKLIHMTYSEIVNWTFLKPPHNPHSHQLISHSFKYDIKFMIETTLDLIEKLIEAKGIT